ncbi:MAG: ATP-binding protein [Rhodobacteraceae bacterium]|nr:ATP-binding protein [Paracoccaceae bacterium]
MHDNEAQLIHLICGSTGAGKTTYSRELARDLNGVVFSIDEWMISLFGEDAPESLSPAWILPRVLRCEKQMWTMALQLGKQGIPAILDFGFQRLEHRQRYASLAKQAQFTAKLHVLNVDTSERWKRVEARNINQGETYHMEITRGMFDYIETTWEPPSNGEIISMSRAG